MPSSKLVRFCFLYNHPSINKPFFAQNEQKTACLLRGCFNFCFLFFVAKN
ncbi:MAG: hypothetical protein U5L45_17175 [Saprospiraceae bacterium]|nr:hypothetical protein [Saprospiraceae bacterium]